jgi:hypothetical protein
LKNIKRIQNQLNYLSEYAKRISRKEKESPEKKDESIILSEIPELDITEFNNEPIKLTKNDINRIDLEAVTNSMSEGLIIYSMDLEVVLINPSLAQMLMPANPKGTGRLILNPDDSLFFERCIEPELFKKYKEH